MAVKNSQNASSYTEIVEARKKIAALYSNGATVVMVVSGAGDVYYVSKGILSGLKLFKAGYGIKIGRLEGLYQLPKIKGVTVVNWTLKNGKRFAVQYGHWKGVGVTPWYQRLYLKLPRSTHNHWPWGRP